MKYHSKKKKKAFTDSCQLHQSRSRPAEIIGDVVHAYGNLVKAFFVSDISLCDI